MKRILTLFLLALLTAKGFCTNYYVSTTGSNANTGLTGSHWLTVDYAVANIPAGTHTLNIGPGTFAVNVKTNPATDLTIVGGGVGITFITSTYSSSTYTDGIFTLYSSTKNTQGNQTISGISFDGMSETCYRAIVVNGRGGGIIRDWDFKNFKDGPATFHGDSYELYQKPATWITGNKFYNNTVTNCSTHNSGFQGLWFAGQDGFEVYNCNFQNLKGGTSGDAISSKTNKRWSIHDNIINRLPYAVGYWNFGVEIRWNYGECKFYNNQITGCADFCWNYSDGYAYSIDVYGNTFGHSLASSSTSWNLGIDLEADTYDAIVRENTFRNLACGILYSISFTGSPLKLDGLTVRNNLFDNIGSPSNLSGFYEAAIRLYTDRDDHTIRDIFIYNNTFKQAAYCKGSIVLGGQGTQRNLRVRNNIVTDFINAPVSVSLGGGTLTIDTLIITHNNFYNNANSNNVSITSVTPTNYTNSNQITTNPLFVSSSDYHLQSGSPARNAGLNVGLPFYESAPDIGAYEYSPPAPGGANLLKVGSTLIKDSNGKLIYN